ncbi:hypothetical protein EV361DRAFT_907222 [Lentinula raphanica]|nr:hypothetical protein EV361DRAFT_907222 [Lentinula raphanica]
MLVTAQLHVPAVWFCIQAETSPSGSHNLDDVRYMSNSKQKLECDIGWREMHGNILYHKVGAVACVSFLNGRFLWCVLGASQGRSTPFWVSEVICTLRRLINDLDELTNRYHGPSRPHGPGY